MTEPIISRVQFSSAAERLRIRRRKVPKEENLAAVARLLKSKGYLSMRLIDQCPYTPCSTVLCRQFGSIFEVYRQVGYKPEGRWCPQGGRMPASRQQILAELRNLHDRIRSEEHTSELQSLMRISYAVFCLKKKINTEK